jgi:hypothetical protein
MISWHQVALGFVSDGDPGLALVVVGVSGSFE